jgi:indole-3-glycerol phosphate synthase
VTTLERILLRKAEEIRTLYERYDREDLKARCADIPPCRNLADALRTCSHVPIIAEVKRVSPSMGKLRDVADVAPLAASYQAAGAAAISVLTDKPFFGGSLEDLCQVRRTVDLPVLRKDFIVDSVQLYETRLSGADAVLLIAAAMPFPKLTDLYSEAVSMGMTPLVEVHNEEEAIQVLDLRPALVGINNRDLATLEVDLNTCVRIRPLIPREILVVGESGINNPDDVERLKEAGMDAFLVGTALMRSDNPGQSLRTLSGFGA